VSLHQTKLPSMMVCRGCGTVVDQCEPYPFSCPRAGDGTDHVLRRVLDIEALTFPPGWDTEPNPFVRYRSLLHAQHLAVAGGMRDEVFVDLVRDLDDAVAKVDGHGFVATPFKLRESLGDAVGLLGPLYVKDETDNVAGSHKGRHLFGLLVHLCVAERLGLVDAGARRPLAIASCGNAALAAAVVAAAGERELLVFVPTDADDAVVDRLKALGAHVTVCERRAGTTGDPTYHRLQAAIAEGALPFTCQGNENGLAIEGGETLGYEMAAQLASTGEALDHVVVQVGGGALASAVAAAFSEAVSLGIMERHPRFHTVQTESAWPLKRAFDRVMALLDGQTGPDPIHRALRQAAHHRSEFMWPWETAPHSIAHGILDDETYDWLAVVEAMLVTGGRPVVVGEEQLAAANALATELTDVDVDATGSSGLAGVVALREHGMIGPGESVAVLFTGARR
jgi:threonine synthase